MYEIWNEQNAGPAFWKPREDPEAYAALLAQTVPAIRAEDPDAVVAMGGLFWPDLVFNTPGPEFLDSVQAHLPDLAGVDAVPIHPYRYPFTAPEVAQDHQGTMVEEICGARAQLDGYGLSDTELWVGELGWHTAPEAFSPGLSLDDQAAVLVRAAVLSFAQGATQFGWYTYRDSGTDPADQEQMFGLVGYDPDPLDGDDAVRKPAFHAFATLTEMLGAHHTIEDLSAALGFDAHTYGYRLTGGWRPVQVLWTDGPTREVVIDVETSSPVKVDLLGQRQVLPSAGRVRLSLGPEPVYLLE
jgi:hypothetical protein